MLIAECHVFHRLLPPRHPPDALLTLDRYLKSMCSGKRICVPHTWISIRHVGFLQTDPLMLTALPRPHCSAEAGIPRARGPERQTSRINLSLTMTNIPKPKGSGKRTKLLSFVYAPAGDGGARRSRTDDLLNANQALSQLSYGPVTPASRQVACPALRCRRLRWWAEEELNFRPHAYQACALTT